MKTHTNIVLIMAGGTGGHVFPGLALAKELQAQGCQVHWLGTTTGIESTLIPQANIPLHCISIKGVRGKGFKGLLFAPFKILLAIVQALQVILRIKPFCIIGFGGFVSGPGAVAAKMLGLPLFIHEQNAIAGTTNKILAKVANTVFVAFPSVFAESKVVKYVGNPVRNEIKKNTRHCPEEPLHVLVLGGSLGAKAINDIMPAVVDQLDINILVCHQTGKAQQSVVKAAYAATKNTQVKVLSFIEDMAAMYQWADLVICRAGAMTVSELAVAGLPAIFVPYPFAIDDHQTANANWMVKEGAAYLMPQQNMTVEKLCNIIKQLDDNREELQQMKMKSAKLGINDAALRMANDCLELLHESK